MKKLISTISAMALICSAACVMAANAEDKTTVSVTIANGDLALTQEQIQVTDIDNDGALTINDALYLAHEAKYEGGAQAGYKATVGQWGLGLDKLWGVTNGGSYGYYVNDVASMGLTDPVKDGDNVYAFVYTDTQGFSDAYSYFNVKSAETEKGEALELTLNKLSWGSDGSTVSSPVEGASITVNGEATELKTDADGKVSVTLDKAGQSIISAKAPEGIRLAPPVAVVQVNGEEEPTEAPTEAPSEAPETTTEEVATTTTTTTTTTVTSTAKTTKNAGNSSPKTGDAGTAASFAFMGASVFAAFALRKRNEK